MNWTPASAGPKYSQSTKKLYSTARWLVIRAMQLRKEPLCRHCRSIGRITEATVCDHVTPHRGDRLAFYAGPFQSLCSTCHDGAKQASERAGHDVGCDAAGNPIGRAW